MSRHRIVRAVGAALLACGFTAVTAGSAAAHPLGNFTTNTAAAISVRPDGLGITYVVDLAEIPTLQALRQVDANGDGTASPAETAAAAGRRCHRIAGDLEVTVGGERVPVRAATSDLELRDGQAGLEVLRMECQLRAAGPLDGRTEIAYRDRGFPDRIGWREVVAVGDGAILLDSDVPATSSSRLLEAYPEGRLASPPEVTTADLVAAPGGGARTAADGGPASAGGVGGVGRLTRAYTSLVAEQELTLPFALLAVGIAVVLGAAHALAPGHGKTVMAAYIVGERGTTGQAVAVGATVAATHTLGVLALGVMIATSETLAPERLYPWFGAVSGLLITAIGVGVLRRALRARSRRHEHDEHAPGHGHVRGHSHDDPRGHDRKVPEPALAFAGAGAAVGTTAPGALDPAPHPHGSSRAGKPRPHGAGGAEHTHSHGGGAPHTHHLPPPGRTRARDLVALGFAGGLVPSPSALVVLLGALALDRAAFGVALVAAYGVGLAITLLAAGLLLVRARGWVERLVSGRRSGVLARVGRALPVLTGLAVVAGGILVAARSLLL